jgi:hypothetical protein
MASKGERSSPMTGFITHSWSINFQGKLLIRDTKHNLDRTNLNITTWDMFTEVGYKNNFKWGPMPNRQIPSVLLFKGREHGVWMAMNPLMATREPGVFGVHGRFHPKFGNLWTKKGKLRSVKQLQGFIRVPFVL